MDIKIEELIELLPEGYNDACFETKAIERQRRIKTPEELNSGFNSSLFFSSP